jgi:hypothetical protein
VGAVSKWYKQTSLLFIGQVHKDCPVNIAVISQLSNVFRGKFTSMQTEGVIPTVIDKGLVDRVVRLLLQVNSYQVQDMIIQHIIPLRTSHGEG